LYLRTESSRSAWNSESSASAVLFQIHLECNEMREAQQTEEVKWWDKRLLVRSVVMGLVFFGLLYTWAMRHKPPEGFEFERVPAISGIYKCCEAGGRSSQSWVGGNQISCRSFSYFGSIGAVRNDCGLKDQLNDQTVEVVRAVVPFYGPRDPLVVRISANGKNFYDINDERIRELWISATTVSAATIAFILVAILHGGQLIYLNRKTKKS
jgi:hypothetical protein